ncbi:protein kinase C [Elysia marginata]|uniref:Protein kinase C n=1 Tax=Elysia marginata TaxID=1093978 RepID=A0AAV4JM54_9GAST|nr:protein kinase C [Elysia marginata]
MVVMVMMVVMVVMDALVGQETSWYVLAFASSSGGDDVNGGGGGGCRNGASAERYVDGRRSKGQQLVQKKRTLYPKWNSCFDAHLYEGRTIQVIIMERPNRNLADVNVTAQALADKCEKATGGTSGPIWSCGARLDKVLSPGFVHWAEPITVHSV